MRTISLTNVGKNQLQKLNKNTPIISITDRYFGFVDIPNRDKRKVLHLSFFACDHMGSVKEEDTLTIDKVKDIAAFLNSLTEDDGDKVYVQCGEGRIRSYTIAHTLYEYAGLRDYFPDLFKDIDFVYDNDESQIKQGIIDRTTARSLVNNLKELNLEAMRKNSDA